jgi:hypothetical protein
MSYITESGIPDLGKIPWGSHFCQMYSTKDDLAQSLIPYFMAGLANNERCIWVTSAPYNTEDAKADFRKILPGCGAIMREGRLKILDYTEWYTSAGSREGGITRQWLEEEQRSLSEGYAGLRIAGNTSFVTPSAWDAFMEYEREIDQSLSGRRIIALCSYNVNRVEPTDVFEMVRAHQFSIRRNNGFWEMLDSDG